MPRELVKQVDTLNSWITVEYLEKVLRNHENDNDLKVTNVKFLAATTKGENYASVMTRAYVEYFTKNVGVTSNLIIKMSFEGDEFASEKMQQYDVYRRELKMYDRIMPKLQDVLAIFGDQDKLCAGVINVDYEHSALIFEDLADKGYSLADRVQGLDMAHAKLVLQKLAKMHASSAILNERSPGIFEDFDRGMFNRHTSAFSPFFENTFEACGELVSQWNDENKIYGEKILKLKPMLMEYGKRVFDNQENHFCALIHGDLWTNNVMFTYDDKKEPIDVLMIDFQFSSWTTPAVDLHYFFNTSLREELRLHHQDELIQYYHTVLTETLQKLEFKGKIPSLRAFWMQFMDKSFYAVTSSCIVQPLMLNEKTDNADFHALMGNDERARIFKRSLFANEKVQKNLKRLLPIFDRRGLLDIN